MPCAASLVNCKAGSKLHNGNLNQYLNVNVHSKHNSTLDKCDSQQDKDVSTSCRVRGYLEEGRLCRQKTKTKKKNDAIIVYLGNQENLRFKNTNYNK